MNGSGNNHLLVKTDTGKSVVVPVNWHSDTVRTLKERIAQQHAIPMKDHDLYFEGNCLDDVAILFQLGLTHTSVLYIGAAKSAPQAGVSKSPSIEARVVNPVNLSKPPLLDRAASTPMVFTYGNTANGNHNPGVPLNAPMAPAPYGYGHVQPAQAWGPSSTQLPVMPQTAGHMMQYPSPAMTYGMPMMVGSDGGSGAVAPAMTGVTYGTAPQYWLDHQGHPQIVRPEYAAQYSPPQSQATTPLGSSSTTLSPSGHMTPGAPGPLKNSRSASEKNLYAQHLSNGGGGSGDNTPTHAVLTVRAQQPPGSHPALTVSQQYRAPSSTQGQALDALSGVGHHGHAAQQVPMSFPTPTRQTSNPFEEVEAVLAQRTPTRPVSAGHRHHRSDSHGVGGFFSNPAAHTQTLPSSSTGAHAGAAAKAVAGMSLTPQPQQQQQQQQSGSGAASQGGASSVAKRLLMGKPPAPHAAAKSGTWSPEQFRLAMAQGPSPSGSTSGSTGSASVSAGIGSLSISASGTGGSASSDGSPVTLHQPSSPKSVSSSGKGSEGGTNLFPTSQRTASEPAREARSSSLSPRQASAASPRRPSGSSSSHATTSTTAPAAAAAAVVDLDILEATVEDMQGDLPAAKLKTKQALADVEKRQEELLKRKKELDMQIAQELAARELAVANARAVEFEFKSKLREAEETLQREQQATTTEMDGLQKEQKDLERRIAHTQEKLAAAEAARKLQRTDVDDKLKALRLSLGMVSASTTSLQHTVEPVQQAAVEQLCSFIRQYGLSDLVQRRLGELNGMGPQSASSTSNGASHGAAGVTSSDAALSASLAELKKELS